MSIHFISGKPGGGKTLYSVRMIVDELVRSDRTIITNVPLLLPRLNEFLQQSYPRAFEDRFVKQLHPAHITDRVILLDEDDLPKFFTFRPGGIRLVSVSNQEWKAGKRPDFSTVKDSGVLYVLDEVHIAFNARAWADTGHEVLYYLSQHRKLGDDVICITQSIGNVDKQFRSVAQDFTYIKNLSKQRAGLFRLPAMFIRSTYAQPATDNSKSMESGTFKLDVSGLASCYDTARGVGIHGRAGADTQARKKGLHWLWFLIGLPLILWALFHFLPIIGMHILQPSRSVSHTASVKTLEVVPVETNIWPHIEPSLFRSNAIGGSSVYCTGYVTYPSPRALMSDGSVVEPPELTLITKHTVTVNGELFKIRPLVNRPEEYVHHPDPIYSPPAPAYQPVNEADVTVIGQPGGSRRPPPRLGGVAAMQRTSPQMTGQGSSQPMQGYGQ